MKNITVRNKQGQIISDQNLYETEEEIELFKKINIENNVFGKPERWVRAKHLSFQPNDNQLYIYPDEIYEDSDVLEEENRPRPESLAEYPEGEEPPLVDEWWVKLRADYIIEVLDYVPPVPQEITMRQARIVLIRSGLYQTIQDAIANSDDEELKVEWEYSQTVRRNWDNLNALTNSLGITSEQLDELFRFGATL